MTSLSAARPVALLWASEAAIYGRFGYGHASPRVHLTGKTKTTAFRPDFDLGPGSVGEVEREQAIPIIKRLHQALLPDRLGALNRNENWWVVKWHDPEQWRACSGRRVPICLALRPPRPTERLRRVSREEQVRRVRFCRRGDHRRARRQ
jgi:hypothetical protein